MKLPTRLRHAFIDWHLKKHGAINRANLVAAFSISTAQASHDLTGFAARHPGRMSYNPSNKVYEATPRWGHQVYADEHHHCVRMVIKLFLEDPQP